jgi:hypothetical protein
MWGHQPESTDAYLLISGITRLILAKPMKGMARSLVLAWAVQKINGWEFILRAPRRGDSYWQDVGWLLSVWGFGGLGGVDLRDGMPRFGSVRFFLCKHKQQFERLVG